MPVPIKYRQLPSFVLFLGLVLSLRCALGQSRQRQRTKGDQSAIILLNRMTLDEKIRLLVGSGAFYGKGQGTDKKLTEYKAAGAAGRSNPIERLKIKSMVFADGSSGLRISPVRGNDSVHRYYTTQFPSPTLLASSWDTALMNNVGKALGDEAKKYGADVLLAPAINIQRNPLGGRNYEYYGEDPLLSGKLAAAMIRGIQSNGVGTALKHFAANNQETNRHTINEWISDRALREIYLKGFEIAVRESSPWTIMSSYNKINGTYTAENKVLLGNVLRREWGYNGFVMSDWFGGKDEVAQENSGNNLIMPGKPEQYEILLSAVRSGHLPVAQVNKNVLEILNVYLKTLTFSNYMPASLPNLEQHAQLARKAASEGMVLLKNDDAALPLSSRRRVAVFGNAAYAATIDFTTKAFPDPKFDHNLIDGLEADGYHCDPSLNNKYTAYLKKETMAASSIVNNLKRTNRIEEYSLDEPTVDSAAAQTDLAIVCISRTSNKGTDRLLDGDFNLSKSELSGLGKISKVYREQHKKVIVIINTCGVIEMASWRSLTDAILLSWQPGSYGGNSVADVLSGKSNPSGKLTVSFPMKYEDVPSAGNFPGSPPSDPINVRYQEGIYVGYRYYDTFKIPVAYPFGYGLSYTQFHYADLNITRSGRSEALTITFIIKNTGNIAGKEVAQLYIKAPGKMYDKPERELKGFLKTDLLQPGQIKKIRFSLSSRELASFDPINNCWNTEAGTYSVHIGNAQDSYLTKDFYLKTGSSSPKSATLTGETTFSEDLKGGLR